MNYIGSKFKLSSWIKHEVKKRINGELSDKVFCDLFAGTSIVGRVFKTSVKQVISNDTEDYSFALSRNYIQNHITIDNKNELINELDAIELNGGGFIYQNYCAGSGSDRQYFSDENGKKIDAIRIKINEWKEQKYIDDNSYYFLLASLLESADKVANTASVYGAFLKKLKSSAQKTMKLVASDFELNDNEHIVYQEDANKLIKTISGDILYLDPPYNARQYGANYHLLNTIAKYDQFEPIGKTGMREYFKSDYCRKGKVLDAFADLIENAKFSHIFLSYNNEGLMSAEEIKDIMQKHGKYSIAAKEYKRYKADSSREYSSDSTIEYLHILEKRQPC